MLKNLLHRLLPNQCILCQKSSKRRLPLCTNCENKLPWKDKWNGAVFHYQSPIKDWISAMKFYDNWHYTQIAGKLMAKHLQKNLRREDYPELLIPIPLHPKRLRKRGFNQALEITKPIAKALNIPIDIKSTKRIINTQAQSELSAKERHINVRGVFEVQFEIKALHIAIIDDVITTGSTANEFVKVLKQNGVKRIDVWACARK